MKYEITPYESVVYNCQMDIIQALSDKRKELRDIKVKIDPVCDLWEKVKQQIHDHEYIYTSSNISHNVSHFYPYSRSYFKMKEILEVYNMSITHENKIACLAEAPGGFIQCLLETDTSQIFGMTLKPPNRNTPYWNRSLFDNQRVSLCEGVSGTGDLYDIKNIMGYVKELGKHSCSLITGDGGFDNSRDYNRQESNSLKLIYSEILLALLLQEQGGTFICKLFDTFELGTISLLYILSLCYETISFYKPGVSRLSNSEKYVVCQGYHGYPTYILNEMLHNFENGEILLDIPPCFYGRILEAINDYTGRQIWSIQKGLDAISNTDYKKGPSSFQLDTAIEWCKTFHVPLNSYCRYIRT